MASRRLSWVVRVLVLWTVFLAVLFLWDRGHPTAQKAPPGAASHAEGLPVLWPVPEFSLVSQTGKTVTPADLRGHVAIADFIFTQCTTLCPILSAKMVQVSRALPDANLRFVSFSVDPAHDTPEALAAYATKWAPRETRWTLLSTKPDSLKAVAAGMHVTAEAQDDKENPILHDGHFALIDASGQVRGMYDAADPEAMKTLERDARTLLGPAPATKPVDSAVSLDDAMLGADVYATHACAGCHDAHLAPSLKGLYGKPVALEGGRTVVADDAYLRRALLQPGEELVKGYAASMPGYASSLDERQLRQIIAYVKSLASESAPVADEAKGTAVDPVCGMSLTILSSTPHEKHDGKTVYFCSDACRTKFEAAPERYTKHSD